MTDTPIITANMLRANGACKTQVELFERTFPNGAKVTVANARKYGALFEVAWAARAWLTSAQAQEAYYAAVRPEREAFDAAKCQARGAYDAAERRPLEAYRAACAVAFVQAYIQQEKAANGG
jgi:cyclopropane fatty-acyl-phospholipid synthase-like methyltransferase